MDTLEGAAMPLLAIHIGIDPVAFHIGPAAVHWYGIGYVVAIAVAIFFCRRYLANRGLTDEQFDTVVPLAIVAGFIGGRLYFLLQNDFFWYLRHPIEMLSVWNGGMAFFGAILGGTLAVAVFAWRKRWPLAPMCDVAAMFALMGQPIGRLGNIVNGGILGAPTHLPWGFVYTNPNSFAPSNTTAYQPAAVYELLCNVVLIALLYPIRKRVAHGWLAMLYVAGYCITQVIVFYWRETEPVLALGLKQAQLTAIALLAVDIALMATVYLRGHKPFGPAPKTAAPSEAQPQFDVVAGR
jgi:phosphatidylglycerol:prolipoprotein diacylglycerol transferase